MTSGISQPTNPGSTSRGYAWVPVTVQSIDGNTATVIDTNTQTRQISIANMPAKGVPPKPGEQWLIHRQYGAWTFGLCMNTPTGGIAEADIVGLPADLDDIRDDVTSVTSTVTTLQNSFWAWAPPQERLIYGDLLSSCSRFVARDNIASTANKTSAMLLGQTPVSFSTRGFRIAVETVASGTVAGGLYTGTSPVSMARIATATTNTIAATGIFDTTWTPVTVPAGRWVAVLLNFSAASIGVAGVTFGTNPGVLTTGANIPLAQGFFTGALPTTVNMNAAGTVSVGTGRLWVALI